MRFILLLIFLLIRFQLQKFFLLKNKKSLENDRGSDIEKVIREQLKRILPTKTIIGFLNLIAWSIFSAILIFGGAQISTLGIKLIK